MFKLFTDGSCYPNPGRGGWAFILQDTKTGNEMVECGGADDTTNNRMELTAVIQALRQLPDGSYVKLTSDSTYVLSGIKTWRFGWRKKKWVGVKNGDLWQELDELLRVIKIEPEWIEGHTGHKENERCDLLALEGRRSLT